jgi:hypothetical protein
MYRRFPYLQYCDDNWKAEQIAIYNYPSWYNSWCKKKDKGESSARIKDEHIDEQESMKHPNDAALDTESKRMKIAPLPEASITMHIDGTPAGPRSFAVGNSDSNFMVRISCLAHKLLHDGIFCLDQKSFVFEISFNQFGKSSFAFNLTTGNLQCQWKLNATSSSRSWTWHSCGLICCRQLRLNACRWHSCGLICCQQLRLKFHGMNIFVQRINVCMMESFV